MQQNEQKINDQILLIEQERKVSQLHNMSMMSHLSVDPAAMVQASMLQHQNAALNQQLGLDTSQLESSFLAAAAASKAMVNDDRYQIV